MNTNPDHPESSEFDSGAPPRGGGAEFNQLQPREGVQKELPSGGKKQLRDWTISGGVTVVDALSKMFESAFEGLARSHDYQEGQRLDDGDYSGARDWIPRLSMALAEALSVDGDQRSADRAFMASVGYELLPEDSTGAIVKVRELAKTYRGDLRSLRLVIQNRVRPVLVKRERRTRTDAEARIDAIVPFLLAAKEGDLSASNYEAIREISFRLYCNLDSMAALSGGLGVTIGTLSDVVSPPEGEASYAAQVYLIECQINKSFAFLQREMARSPETAFWVDPGLRMAAGGIHAGCFNLLVIAGRLNLGGEAKLMNMVYASAAAKSWAGALDLDGEVLEVPWLTAVVSLGSALESDRRLYWHWVGEVLQQVSGTARVSHLFLDPREQIVVHILSALRSCKSGFLTNRSVAEMFNAGVSTGELRKGVPDPRGYWRFGLLVNAIGVHWSHRVDLWEEGSVGDRLGADELDCLANLGALFTEAPAGAMGETASLELSSPLLLLLHEGQARASDLGLSVEVDRFKRIARQLVKTWRPEGGGTRGLEGLSSSRALMIGAAELVVPGITSRDDWDEGLRAHAALLNAAYVEVFGEPALDRALENLRGLVDPGHLGTLKDPRRILGLIAPVDDQGLASGEVGGELPDPGHGRVSLALRSDLVMDVDWAIVTKQVAGYQQTPSLVDALSDDLLSRAFEST